MAEVSKEILEAVKNTAKEGRITCTAARKLAGDFKVSPGVIGEACDQLKIKITACELGCF